MCLAGTVFESLQEVKHGLVGFTAGLVARPSSCTNSGTHFLAVASSTRQNLPRATQACACNASPAWSLTCWGSRT